MSCSVDLSKVIRTGAAQKKNLEQLTNWIKGSYGCAQEGCIASVSAPLKLLQEESGLFKLK